MSIDVDVRETKLFWGYLDPMEVQLIDHRLRFRVTDDHYLYYKRYVDSQSWLTISIMPPPAAENVAELDYEVILFYETSTSSLRMVSCVYTPNKTEELAGRLAGVTKIEMRFVVKSQQINRDRAMSPQLSRGQTMTISKSWYDTMQAHMSTSVTLVGSDGEVVTRKLLLTAHSVAFEAMFSLPTSLESQTGRVVIKDYSKASLKSMVHFLASHEIIDGNNTACDLLLLADKYGIKELKLRSEKFLLDNVDNGNARGVFRIFMRVSSQLLEELFVKAQVKQLKLN